jgi:hypothetical protein
VEPADLAPALRRVLSHPDALEPLAFEARESAERRLQTAEIFAERVEALVLQAMRQVPAAQPALSGAAGRR